MNRQRHVIMRQTVELAISRSENAWPLQQRVSEIMRGARSVIERCCDELSSPDSLHRIDSLELDVGELDSNRLEQDLLDKLAGALRAGLAERIARQEAAPIPNRIASRLELFNHFARTGTLPWWADMSLSGQVAENLDRLLEDAPVLLIQQLTELGNDAVALRRIAGHFDDRRLAAVIMQKAPELGAFPSQLCRSLLSLPGVLPALMAISSAKYRNQVWERMLAQTLGSTLPLRDPVSFGAAVLLDLASLNNLTYKALALALKQVATHENTADIVQRVAQSLSESYFSEAAAGDDRTSTPPHFLKTLNNQPFLELQQWLEPNGLCPAWLKGWPSPLQDGLFKHLTDFGNELTDALQQMRIWLAQDDAPAPVWLQNWPAILRDEFISQLGQLTRTPHPAAVSSAPNPMRPKQESIANGEFDLPIRRQDSFSDADLIHLENAGLIVLWPFFNSFFVHLGILEDGNFIDDAARQRAIALMHYLVTANSEVQEYQVPLNKILCGVLPDWLLENEVDLTEDDLVACDTLLEAAIGQAPILNNMSIAGFRGSFLVHNGVLEIRDGSWLLRVERETHDLVLDRFPWSFSWVKLPWMPLALQVEW